MACSWHSRNYRAPIGWTASFFVLWMLLRTIPRRSAGRWLLVACFSCVKNHNVSGPHLFPSFTTQAKKIPLPPLGRSYSEQKNHFAMQFQTLFLPHRFIKIRPSHQTPVSIECLTICRIPEFPKSEQNQKSCGNMRIWRKTAAVCRKNLSNLNKSFGMNMGCLKVPNTICTRRG